MRREPRQQITASADGTPLFLRHQPRRRPGRFTVLLGHAMTIHSGLLGPMIDQMADLGCDVWAGDLRGHGQSVSARAPLAHLDPDTGWNSLVDDMAALAKRAFDGVPPEDCVMIGGVLSGQAMLLLLQRQPDVARHLVMAPPSPRRTGATRLAASFLRLRQLVRPVDRPDPQLKHHVYSFLKAGLPAGSGDADVISAHPDVVDAILADPRGFPTPTMGYWLNVVPGLQRVWDEIRPGDLHPDTRVLLISSPDDPQLSGQRLAVQVQHWFFDQGLRDCAYVDLPGARANPMVDAAHLPISAVIMDWLHKDSSALAPQAAVSGKGMPTRDTTSPYSSALDMIGLSANSASADLPGLIQLCYAALEDDARWMELIYRLCLVSERDSQLVEHIMEAIQPHWQRAYELREELRKAAMMGVIYSDVMDRLDLAVGLVDGDGSLRHANSAFDRTLEALMPDMPKPLAPAERSARLLSAQPGWPPPNQSDNPILWNGKLIGVSFVPGSLLRQTGNAPGQLPRLIVLRGTNLESSALDHRAGLLTLSFGLTGQESQVALQVAEGHSTEQIAERLAMSSHTVRSHLKQVFSKMGVTSRTELSSQIMASPLGWMTGQPAATGSTLGDGQS
jgi:DNA-binding CsgD family transcriptional regulator/alpha-beta hydrolase superfamily lysophospholipase